MPPRIALVDDDRNFLTSIAMALEAEGFDTETWSDPMQAWHGMRGSPVDLAVLDIKMPGMDGMELLRRLRGESALPIIFLTSKDQEADEALGLSMGADDYIAKPVSQLLLLARIRALLRRSGWRFGEEPEAEERMARGELEIDGARHECRWRGEAVTLTVTEFLILKSLAARPGVVKSRAQLMDEAYGDHGYVDDRTIDSHIKRMRGKFRRADPDFARIETLYGVGYRYRAD